MRTFLGSFAAQARLLLASRRYGPLLLVLLAATWVSVDIYRHQTLEEVPVAFLDMDGSSVSRTIALFSDAARELKVVSPPPQSQEEARQWLVQGRVAAVVVAPEGLADAVKRGDQEAVTVLVEMGNILLGRNVQTAMARVLTTVNAGVGMKVVQKMGVPREHALATVVPVSVDASLPFNPGTNYAWYLAPGVALFLLHVYLLIAALSAFRSASGRLDLLGRLAAVLLLGIALEAAWLYLLLPARGIVVHSGLLPVALVVLPYLVLTVVLVYGVNLLFRMPVLVMEVTIFLGMLSLMLSGITFPTDAFPWPLQWFSYVLPFTPYARGMRIFIHSAVEVSQLGGILTFYGWLSVFYAGVIVAAKAVYGLVGRPGREASS